ncbi:hypothetical protein AB1K62_12475 [Parasphingorhabdus sp. JC815]|uniref:hypothetical protein n=1 Tax=Parasphingorhabdus sp. JC815 TaxID=3232140 RepID=UPI00345AD7E7
MAFLSRPLLLSAAALLPLTLAACGSKDNDAELAELDENLTGDPAMREALEGPIMVDPDLTAQSNRNAIRGANGPVDGKVPPDSGQAARIKGKLLSAPKPRKMTAEDECADCAGSRGITLGAKAEAQNAKRGKGACDQKLSYDMGWANRMPAAFPVYPKANVKEAAGAQGGGCNIRVVSFYTGSAMKNVVDYYYTQAKRSGYSAEYLLRGSEHVLGGTRGSDDGAYVITLNKRSGGGTLVDIVANNGS